MHIIILSMQYSAFPNLFSTMGQFHGRQFFSHEKLSGWGVSGMIQAHYIQAPLPLCGLVPNRPTQVPVHDPEFGDPCNTLLKVLPNIISQ